MLLESKTLVNRISKEISELSTWRKICTSDILYDKSMNT